MSHPIIGTEGKYPIWDRLAMDRKASRDSNLLDETERTDQLTGKDGAPIQTAEIIRYDISDKPLTADEWTKAYASSEG
jgi:hypothetical protein